MRKRSKIFVRAIVFFGLLAITLIIYSSFKNSYILKKATRFSKPNSYNFSNIRITNTKSNYFAYTKLDKSLNNFLRKWQLAGASVAIAKDGKLLYAKGFGFANKEDKVLAEPYNIFRIASVSKLITATAIMKLIEEDKLSLDSRVFGTEGVLNDPKFLDYKDKRVEDITVKNLLNHSAGWSSRWGDHMFINDVIAKSLGKDLPVSLDDIVVFALSKRLHFKPGNHSSYSNLGYAILQLVIEKVAQQPYEDYVKREILEPIGIQNAHIAFNYDNQKYPDEVKYYEVPEAEMVTTFDGKDSLVLKSRGGNDIRTLGAAGGWVISSVDLVKFLLSIDASSTHEDILNQNTIIKMTEQDGHFHPFGWRWVMSNGKWWRSGSFPGTSALAVIRDDGFTYVFLTNSSPWSGARFPYEVDRLMSRLISSIQDWPDIDLFNDAISKSTYFSRRSVEIYQPLFTGKFTAISTFIPPAD